MPKKSAGAAAKEKEAGKAAEGEEEVLEGAAGEGAGGEGEGAGEGGEGGGDNAAAELAKLREENALLRGRAEGAAAAKPATTARTVSVDELEAFDDSQKEWAEKETGLKFDEIVRRARATERRYQNEQNQNLAATIAVNDALDTMVESDPQAVKLKGGIKEYLADVPAADKLDPARLKAHLLRAKTFAKGKLAESGRFGGGAGAGAGAGKGKGIESRGGGNPRGDGGGSGSEMEEGEVNYGEHRMSENFTLKIKPLITEKLGKKKGADIRDRIKHPDIANSVLIPRDFDEKPAFD